MSEFDPRNTNEGKDKDLDGIIRPQELVDFTGQGEIVSNLRVYIKAALLRGVLRTVEVDLRKDVVDALLHVLRVGEVFPRHVAHQGRVLLHQSGHGLLRLSIQPGQLFGFRICGSVRIHPGGFLSAQYGIYCIKSALLRQVKQTI